MAKRKNCSDKPLVFVSHIHEDAPIASALQAWVDDVLLGAVDFFVSTDNKSLPPGTDWLAVIKKSLAGASIALLLITPRSHQRNWIYFEAGAAYIREIPTVPVCLDGFLLSNLKPPLSCLQSIEIPSTDSEKRLIQMIAKSAGLRAPKTVVSLSLPTITYGGIHGDTDIERSPESDNGMGVLEKKTRMLVAKHLFAETDTRIEEAWGEIAALSGPEEESFWCLLAEQILSRSKAPKPTTTSVGAHYWNICARSWPPEKRHLVVGMLCSKEKSVKAFAVCLLKEWNCGLGLITFKDVLGAIQGGNYYAWLHADTYPFELLPDSISDKERAELLDALENLVGNEDRGVAIHKYLYSRPEDEVVQVLSIWLSHDPSFIRTEIYEVDKLLQRHPNSKHLRNGLLKAATAELGKTGAEDMSQESLQKFVEKYRVIAD